MQELDHRAVINHMQTVNAIPKEQAYTEHLSDKLAIFQKAMEQGGYDRLIVGSGSQNRWFHDDCLIPYRANAYFEEFVSLPQHPNSFLVITAEKAPHLHIQIHDDYWHSEPDPLSEEITNAFVIKEYRQEADISFHERTAYIGPDTNGLSSGLSASLSINPQDLLPWIDYHRAWKTEYEIDCMRQANQLAVSGHLIAEKSFRQGLSEYEIHMAYLTTIQASEADLPYDNIMALNDHAAVLHHMHLSQQRPASPKSFLIDAGARFQGYAADISRTYAYSESDSDFNALIRGVDSIQQDIAKQAHAGQSYLALHLLTHRLIAGLLAELDILKCSGEEAFDSGLTRAFFPHGLGHFIGVQVHDLGGDMANPYGELNRPPEEHPFLRLTRTIEEKMVLTIEPGVYFIPQLLAHWRGKGLVNESLVDKLLPFGGVRIEDNIVARKNDVENLTRNAFAT